MKKIIFFLLILVIQHSFAQYVKLSDNAQISVITVDPGANLVDSFGHSAFRIKDEVLGIDQAYNYGTYDFNRPNFYLNFARGKLLYDLSSYPFYYFLKSYVQENRTVKEQILNLTQHQKQQFFEFLQNNVKPETKSYLYDFLYDNCATKLPQVSEKILNDKIQFNYDFIEGKSATFRDQIHKYLGKQPWGKFGIDLALGSVIDKKMKPQEYEFLPDYVFEAYQYASIKNSTTVKPLVSKTNILFTSQPLKKESFYVTPLLVFTLLALLVIFISYKDYTKKQRSKWLDFLMFFVTGLLGVFVLLLWFATDHSATAKNFNTLWAFAPNFLIAFLLCKPLKKWLKKYLILLLLLILLTVFLWITKTQVFNLAVLPILIMLTVRYLYLLRTTNI